jgi:hypothetical protein
LTDTAGTRSNIIQLKESLDETSHALFGRGIVKINDALGKEAVLTVFDKLIVQLEEKVS